jgi:RHS repeat-associated protein
VFPGQYFDSLTGLNYNYFRYYDPGTGRYITAGPAGLDGGINLYAYVDNNPVNYFDPNGLGKTGKNRSGSGTQPDYSPCDYYRQVGNANGCKYHQAAHKICRGEDFLVNTITTLCGVSTSELNCIRKCLVGSDRKARDDPGCQTGPGDCGGTGCTKKTCIDNYYRSGFESCGVSKWCYGGNYGPYPNDGN